MIKAKRMAILSICIGALTLFALQLFGLNILWLALGESSGGFTSVATIIGASFVFKAFSSLIIGVLVDRFQKKKTIVVSLAACAALASAWIVLSEFLVVAVLVYLAIDLVSDLYSDAFAALVAEKLTKQEYVKLDALELMSSNAVAIAGRIASAALIASVSQVVVFGVVVFVLLLSALICQLFLPESNVRKKESTRKKEQTGISIQGIILAVQAAWVFVRDNIIRDTKIMVFMGILFFLNLDYAFIPSLLPFYIMSEAASPSLVYVAIMSSGNDIGEFLAASIVLKYGHLVSRLTKIGLAGSALVFALLPFVYQTPAAATLIFIVYGFFDTLTQPFYSYFVASVAADKRGRILGVVNFVVLLASPLGILLGTLISRYGMVPLTIGIVSIFAAATLVVSQSTIYGRVKLDPDEGEDEDETEDEEEADTE
ncbi:MAG: MFS transporter [Thermaerobacter sp.]|nr:MFS transporter [Thermaerobacter sp.]